MIYRSASLKEFKANTLKIISKLLDREDEVLVIGLTGDLGSGKTLFVKNFLSLLGVKENVISPTFVIMREYNLRQTNFKRAYHIDVYRLENPGDVLRLGLKQITGTKGNIIFVEWADKIKKLMPAHTIWIRFKHGTKKEGRDISFDA